jgi:hypothetical protein
MAKKTKAATVRKEVLKAKQREPVGPFTMALSEIRRDAMYQVRDRLVPDNIKRLRTAYELDKKVAPILIAFVDGEDLPFVIDGHHRYAALEGLEAETVEAVAVATSKREARWRAAEANLTHGQRLSTRELRGVFQAYISTRQHVLPNGASQSYLEIGRAIGVRKSTVYNWMKKDFPKLARAMGREDIPSGPGELRAVPHPIADRLGDIRGHLKGLRDQFELADALAQQEVLGMVERTLAVLREVHEAAIKAEDPFR